MPRASIGTIVNVSVSEVLKRSIVTSTITLLPIVALFIFGGATLQDFAFAIMVGIAVGAVSTIFIATPILSSLLERDQEYAGRRGEAFDAKARGTHHPRGRAGGRGGAAGARRRSSSSRRRSCGDGESARGASASGGASGAPRGPHGRPR